MADTGGDQNSQDASLLLTRANNSVTRRRFDDAASSAAAALSSGGGAKASSVLISSLLQLGEPSSAVTVGEAAASAFPGDASIEAALQDAREASTLSASLSPASASSAGSSTSLPEADEAVKQAATLASRYPVAEPFALAFASALLSAHRYDAAVRALRGIERQRSEGVQGLRTRILEVSIGSSGVASTTISLEVNPTPSLPCLLAKALVGTGEFPSALTVLETTLRSDPDGTTADGKGVPSLLKAIRAINNEREKANTAYKAGNHAEAGEAYAAAAATAESKLGFPVSTLLANLAASKLTGGRYEEAMEACRAALRAWPGNATVWRRLAKAAMSITPADADTAVSALEAYSFLKPDDAEAAKELFKARAKAGESAGPAHPNNDAAYTKIATAHAGAVKNAWGKPSNFPPLWGASTGAALPPSRVLIADFFATWCGPCKMIGPVFEQMAASNAVAAYVKVDGDKCPGVAQAGGAVAGAKGAAAPAQQQQQQQQQQKKGNACGSGACDSKGGACGGSSGGGGAAVRAFPTFISFLDGNEIGRMEGADPKKLAELCDEAVAAWKRCPPAVPQAFAASRALSEAAYGVDGRPDVVAALAIGLRGVGV